MKFGTAKLLIAVLVTRGQQGVVNAAGGVLQHGQDRSAMVVAPLMLDGAIIGDVFRAYVEQFLAPITARRPEQRGENATSDSDPVDGATWRPADGEVPKPSAGAGVIVTPQQSAGGATFGWHQIFFYDAERDSIEVHQDINA